MKRTHPVKNAELLTIKKHFDGSKDFLVQPQKPLGLPFWKLTYPLKKPRRVEDGLVPFKGWDSVDASDNPILNNHHLDCMYKTLFPKGISTTNL